MFLVSHGVEPGQTPALYMQNSPEFIFIWLGLLAIGCAPAMINWSLSADPLVHCLRIAGGKLLLVDEEQGCQDRVESQRKRIEGELNAKIVVLAKSLKKDIAQMPAFRPNDTYRSSVQAQSPVALIYTSGTTGLPKAFPFQTDRVYMGATMWDSAFQGQKKGPGADQWYLCMPLYHGTAGILALNCMLAGIAIAIAKKFSTSHFWQDVHDSGSTGIVYVGEAARYLLAAPPSPFECDHKLKRLYGNGLRPDVWTKFQARFNIPEVLEFFNSTEGMFGLYSYSKGPYQVDAVGHHGAILRYLFHHIYVPVEVDSETNSIWRSPATGFAKRKAYTDGGEILVKVPDSSAFPGYVGAPEATAKKFAFDVFKKGDVYYRTGDALRRTDDGHWYFLDRLGDTYRWKSENISTAEVALALGNHPGIIEANVYGVLIPGYEGRAGCAAVDLAEKDSFDWKGFAKHVTASLPRYAAPVFIRVMAGEIGGNSSHNSKQNKVPLRLEGVDPKLRGTKVPGGDRDQVYWLKPMATEYIPFTEQDWDDIVTGKSRL
ncbi:hypothetical protein MMC13_004816 [Lambiella insularis]|nr:hypothetical protein [Lambiella insularis]